MTERPSLLWVLCDQLRTDALGCCGSPLPTPAVDQSAAEGVRFTQCLVNSPGCVPSRVAMLTGRSPERTSAYDNEAQAAGYPWVEAPPTFPDLLARTGYRSASFGKSHVPPGTEAVADRGPARGGYA